MTQTTKRPRLGEGARAKLKEFLVTAEGREFLAFLWKHTPAAVIDAHQSHCVEIAAITGAQNKGWQLCVARIEELAEPEKQ